MKTLSCSSPGGIDHGRRGSALIALWLACGLALAPVGGLRAAEEPNAIMNSLGMKLVRIGAGTFTLGQDGPPIRDYKMATHAAEFGRADWDETPAHRVTITRAFFIGATEVNLEQYRRFYPGFRPGAGAADEAAGGVSWNKAIEFCAWLSQKEGRTYRLPTEAEWEYACRAGTTTLFSTGDTLPAAYLKWFGKAGWKELYFPEGKLPAEYAWREGPATLHVAQRPPNAWGLHDMHGNVAEWCSDWYGPYEAGPQSDPLGRHDGDFRVFRGGAHSNLARQVRSANRGAWLPDAAIDYVGFRVVLAEPSKGTPLPPAPPTQNAHSVRTGVARTAPRDSDAPFFAGPKLYVRVPPNSYGPLFSRHNHSPAIAECPNGDLLAIWYSCISEPGTELCNLASRLRVGATEWEPASPFWDGADINDHAPKLWWDGERTLYHFAMGEGENIFRTSTDSGATWSKARLMFPHGELGNNPVRMRDGLLVFTHDDGHLVISRDDGRIWTSTAAKRAEDEWRPGGTGASHAGIHAPIVELLDGRWMTFGRLNSPDARARFAGMTPVSYTNDQGRTWTYETGEFPVITNTQRQVLIRLREGPLLLCSFTDQWREWRNRKGLIFKSTSGDFTGFGLFAAVSFDEGRTWPHRRLVTPGGAERKWTTTDGTRCVLSETMAEPTGYLAATQSRDGHIQLITSQNHYTINLAWLKQLPPAPPK